MNLFRISSSPSQPVSSVERVFTISSTGLPSVSTPSAEPLMRPALTDGSTAPAEWNPLAEVLRSAQPMLIVPASFGLDALLAGLPLLREPRLGKQLLERISIGHAPGSAPARVFKDLRIYRTEAPN
ncbi:hypothetical protein PtB15_13B401 [Puccinia triticina]|nr:hypothetical protein PtB15_13B401 [Puccinia triticina]